MAAKQHDFPLSNSSDVHVGDCRAAKGMVGALWDTSSFAHITHELGQSIVSEPPECESAHVTDTIQIANK